MDRDTLKNLLIHAFKDLNKEIQLNSDRHHDDQLTDEQIFNKVVDKIKISINLRIESMN